MPKIVRADRQVSLLASLTSRSSDNVHSVIDDIMNVVMSAPINQQSSQLNVYRGKLPLGDRTLKRLLIIE